ncbi:glycosyltransferase family 25 protein [Halotalea alkalilenta]|uniref:glycosyltransferase family 25 protein n=1 Tax=Halotalea alkalilenta TaxID=376489 RepID=UPI0009DD8C6A|nr:glycosyltransferase family 25 protein [Halotalea alkalilenta]
MIFLTSLNPRRLVGLSPVSDAIMSNIPIYLLSLDRTPERRKPLIDYFGARKIDYTLVSAVDGRELDDDYVREINSSDFSRRMNRPISIGEIGCLLSHQKIYSDILRKGNEWSIVLEDDALIDERFDTFCRIDLGNFDPNTLYILGGQDERVWRDYIMLSLWKNFYVAPGIIFSKTIRSYKHVSTTCCYLIHTSVVRKMVTLHQQSLYIADDWRYLHDHGAFDEIYLADFIAHPAPTLTNSTIEIERDVAKASYKYQRKGYGIKNVLRLREAKRFIRRQFRKLYRLGW